MPRSKSSVTNVEYAEEVSATERLKRKSRSKKNDQAKGTSKSNKGNTNSNGSKSKPKPTKKKPIKRLRQARRQQSAHLAALAQAEESSRKKRKVDAGIDHPGNIVASAEPTNSSNTTNSANAIDGVDALAGEQQADISDFYWEVESVVGRRIHRGRVEYLIRWKGCSEEENTWEPAANLCDTAMEEAMRYVKAQKLKEKKREEDEKLLFGDDTQEQQQEKEVKREVKQESKVAEKTDVEMEEGEEEIVEDGLWDWSDQNQVVFNPVQRINVNDPNAPSLVREARINGTPLVLVGHVGWANFAKRWISKRQDDVKSEGENALVKDGAINDASENVNEAKEGEKMDVEGANIVSEPASSQNSPAGQSKDKCGDGAICVPLGSELNGATGGGAVEQGTTEGNIVTDPVEGGLEGNKAVAEIASSADLKPDAGVSATADDTMVKTSKSDVTATVVSETQSTPPSQNDNESSLLDLSKGDYYLDINKMIQDIGDEDVPVIKRNYNEVKPIHGNIHAAKFLTNCWPNADSDTETAKTQKMSPKLYLHQWQFPLSDTAGRKLCHQNNPLPKSIMGEDLLKYWLDLPQCKLDSPLQYIFMGREDTLSKLHNDPGGLDISIAPIVGEKECVLVHRADGSNCLYHLQASLNDIDLHQYPLLSQAKIWRTIIHPGEILLMPHGTYHQCRNVTPCLSYSRFHLDTVNLLPFVQSLVNGDAPEIDHEEILWNLTTELISKIDKVFDHTQSLVKEKLSTEDDLDSEAVETVNILRMLRHFVREVARRHEIRQSLKGEEMESDHCFSTLVDDVDMCLHEFRFRKMRTIPPFKARQGKALRNTISKGGRKDVIKTDLSKYEMGGKPVVAFNTVLEVNYMSLRGADVDKLYPHAAKKKVGEKLIETLAVGDLVNVRLEQKAVKAEVLEVVSQMHSAYISFEDYPSVYDEWQPTSLLRAPDRAELSPGDIKPGIVVIDLSNKNEYRAKVLSTLNSPMVRMRLFVSQHAMERWVSPDMILGRYEAPKKEIKTTKKRPTVELVEVETKVAPCRPKTGEVVEVYRKGAAFVTKCHYDSDSDVGENLAEALMTHIDVRYILGQAVEEKMVPIGLVRLAPELDPNSGRSQRQTPKVKNDDS